MYRANPEYPTPWGPNHILAAKIHKIAEQIRALDDKAESLLILGTRIERLMIERNRPAWWPFLCRGGFASWRSVAREYTETVSQSERLRSRLYREIAEWDRSVNVT